MKNNILQFNRCANCGACENICPVDAIYVKSEKFFYSVCVNEKKCINCGKCVSVCPVNNQHDKRNLIAGYAGYVDDNFVLFNSSSGGIFNAIAKKIIEKNGVVYGAAFSNHYHSVNFFCTDDIPLKYLQKSKYVESNVGKSFRNIKKDLENKRDVMFCGTPCQCAGLKRYLGKEYDNLIVCDFSCGGLPSHKIYDNYLQSIEKKFKSKVKYVDFRPKNYGWENYSIYIKLTNGKIYTRLASLDPYYKAFLNGLNKRDYCYCCDFADNHYSDLILADFWLYKNFSFENNMQKGLSLVLTNSKKGEQIIKEITEKVILKKIPLDKASYNIKSGYKSEALIKRHEEFFELIEKKDFITAVDKFLPSSIRDDWKKWLLQIFKKNKYQKRYNHRN